MRDRRTENPPAIRTANSTAQATPRALNSIRNLAPGREREASRTVYNELQLPYQHDGFAQYFYRSMQLSEFASGALFAVGLFSSGVYRPEVIKAQFSFSSNVMITTMMAASAASAIVIDLADRFGIMKKKHSQPSSLGFFSFDSNLIGGLLIGLGMATTGSCPGTSFAQVGAGNINGVLVVIGGLLGAITFVRLQDSLTRARAQKETQTAPQDPPNPTLSKSQSKTPLDIATALGIPPMVLLLIWVPMCLAVMRIAFARDRSQALSNPGILPPAYGGLFIGLAQFATVSFAGHALGASSGYEHVARWLQSKVTSKPSNGEGGQPLLTGSVIFSIGIVCSAAMQNYIFNGVKPFANNGIQFPSNLVALQMVAGGWAMVLGSRVARGCTSGHGISGLSKFSLPSLVTTASMFGMGIASTAMLRH
ncbi:uncharacterized protein LTR77_007766 [Saxophila tyrrhenica]|uniref:Sulphur transport domain-containing protein n=1 Tax=Saxophila tyrrhenica TaxID=1690608 RepID=A0AAV9P6C1_9PEZI|nr:hypothetical protein LTR77_007766 [Saxophila tyrrhenica]